MLHLKEVPESNIVELTLDGNVTEEDFMVVTTILENKINKQGKLKLLEEVKSFKGMPLKLYLKDLKFVLLHRNHFEKAAVVSDRRWPRLLAWAAKPLFPTQIRCFEHKDIKQARTWLAA